MNTSATPVISTNARTALLTVAMLGFLGPNGYFLWKVATDLSACHAALSNPVSLIFIGEAFAVMFVLAWLIHRSGRRPGWIAFIAMSIAGGLIFSIPAWLWLATRPCSAANTGRADLL